MALRTESHPAALTLLLASILGCSFHTDGNAIGGPAELADDDDDDDDADDGGDDDDGEAEAEASDGDDPDTPEGDASSEGGADPGDDDGDDDDDDGDDDDDDDDGATAGEGGETGSAVDEPGGSSGGPAPIEDEDEDEDEERPVEECPMPVTALLWADDADVEAPMSLAVASGANEEPAVAISAVAEEGTVTFTLEVPCAGEYYVHGLVWDLAPGAWADPDADSFYFGVGAGEEIVWRYGCQTAGLEGALSWQPLQMLEAQPCEASGVYVAASGPGPITMTLRNREAGDGSAVAGIAAVAISTDPGYDPYDDYAPY